jgi:hypothetical protein
MATGEPIRQSGRALPLQLTGPAAAPAEVIDLTLPSEEWDAFENLARAEAGKIRGSLPNRGGFVNMEAPEPLSAEALSSLGRGLAEYGGRVAGPVSLGAAAGIGAHQAGLYDPEMYAQLLGGGARGGPTTGLDYNPNARFGEQGTPQGLSPFQRVVDVATNAEARTAGALLGGAESTATDPWQRTKDMFSTSAFSPQNIPITPGGPSLAEAIAIIQNYFGRPPLTRLGTAAMPQSDYDGLSEYAPYHNHRAY